jgi:hypothetical protein
MARRLYLGSKSAKSGCHCATFTRFRSLGLPPDARSDDVAKFFDGYGRIVDCRVMTGDFRFYVALSSLTANHQGLVSSSLKIQR